MAAQTFEEDLEMKKRILAALLCAGLVTFAPAGTMAQTPVGGGNLADGKGGCCKIGKS